MALNLGKFRFICFETNTEIENFIFKDTYIRELIKKAPQKISALSRISNQLNDSKKTFSLTL